MTSDQFKFGGKDKGLEDILKIPTLEKVKFVNLEFPFFSKAEVKIDNKKRPLWEIVKQIGGSINPKWRYKY
jgi:hypothetical protein